MIQMSQRLSMQQKQSPQQVLLSTLLQLPVLRLEQRIKQELELNPLLEIDLDMDEEMEQEQIEEKDREEESEEADEEEEPREEIPEEETQIDWDEILNDEDNYEIRAPKERPEEEIDRPEPSPVTLMDHLMEQLHLAPLNEHQQEIGEYLLWCIDEAGYLQCDLADVADHFEVNIPEVEAILNVIQNFDPVGIGARNLQECLLLQLEAQDIPDDVAIRMIQECYDDFTNRRFEKVAKKLELELEEVREIMEVVARLNPKPGESFSSDIASTIIPDVIVERDNGQYKVSLNDWNLPRLRINESYKALLKDKTPGSKETRDYIRQRLESARWLINSIYQRRSTIQRVMESIVKHQKEFFDKGKEFLKPMILKDIAEDVHLDISTVSRVTSGKYVQTETGVFELKYFFSERMETADGDDVSNKLIKQKIKDMIDNENFKKPYNDQTLSEMLKKEGFLVARRTVAKYREQMGLPVARLRRKI